MIKTFTITVNGTPTTIEAIDAVIFTNLGRSAISTPAVIFRDGDTIKVVDVDDYEIDDTFVSDSTPEDLESVYRDDDAVDYDAIDLATASVLLGDRFAVEYSGGQSRYIAEDCCDYMLCSLEDREGYDLELYAEYPVDDDDEDANYGRLKSDILDQAAENGIPASFLRFFRD